MRAGLAIFLCALSVAACTKDEKYEGLAFEMQSAPPIPVSIESDRIELVAGVAVKVRAKPLSEGRAYTKDDLLSLRADDENVFQVYGAVDPREFVLVGLREGRSCLQVSVKRIDEECIDVRVSAATADDD